MSRILKCRRLAGLASSTLFVIAAQFASHAVATLAPPNADTYVASGSPNKNNGAAPNIIVNSTSLGLFQFDTSTLPAGFTSADVEKATLILFVNKVTTAGSINVVAVAAPWTEELVTYATRPGLGAVLTTVPITAASLNQLIVVDVTNQVRSWVTTPSSNHGFELVAVGATSVQFDTKENTIAPSLDITLRTSQADLNVLGAAIDSLTARVSKLEGQITAADLVGTYAINGFQTEIFDGGSPGFNCCHVSNYIFLGTATLEADGTITTLSLSGERGTILHMESTPFWHAQINNPPEVIVGQTWNYSGGTLNVNGGVGAFAVVAGGRLLVHTGANQSDGTMVMLLLTRTN